MIEKEKILELINDLIEERDHFIVRLDISTGNSISLLVDNMKGIRVNECVEISRAIERGLDREKEDYDLTVSSPGLDAPFRVLQQYTKNIGREVKVLWKDGRKMTGKLIEANENAFMIEEKKKVKVEGKKKKQTVVQNHSILLNDVKEVKVVIKF
ncbi:MAG: ribosome assembly cofactor RimP [Bacteroidales bacterium]|jgi:ribosome maturation factor RimP